MYPRAGKPSDAAGGDIVASGSEAIGQSVAADFQIIGTDRADHEIRADPAFAEERIGADLAGLVRALDLPQQFGDLAFRHPAAERFGQQRRAAFELALGFVAEQEGVDDGPPRRGARPRGSSSRRSGRR